MSQLNVNTINEHATNNGVTIETVLIKDGEVDGIDVSAIGTWQDWTPTINNATQGNGTVTARYVQIGKLVIGMFTFTLGSTSAVSGDVNITLPVTGATTNVNLASLSYVENATLSSSVPFTWGTGDVISFGFSYEAA